MLVLMGANKKLLFGEVYIIVGLYLHAFKLFIHHNFEWISCCICCIYIVFLWSFQDSLKTVENRYYFLSMIWGWHSSLSDLVDETLQVIRTQCFIWICVLVYTSLIYFIICSLFCWMFHFFILFTSCIRNVNYSLFHYQYNTLI